AVLDDGGASPALVDAVLASARAHPSAGSPGALWTLVAPPPARDASREEAPPPPRPVAASTWAYVAICALALLVGLGLAVRRRRAPSTGAAGIDDDAHLTPLLVALGVLSAASVALFWATFRFALDDYTYLMTAAHDPWRFDEELRVVGVRLPFAAGHRLGPFAFAAANTLALVGLLGGVFGLARRLGLTRREAGLAALLVGVQPGVIELARYAAGLQQLLVLAFVLGALAAFGDAFEARGRRRIGLALVGAGAAGLAVLTKWLSAVLLVPAVLVWTGRTARDGRGWAARVAVALGLAAWMGAPVVLAGLGPSDRAGTARLAERALALGEGLGALALRLAVVVGGLLLMRRGRTSGRLRLPDRRTVWVLGASALLFAVPFLFNERYYKHYYALFPALWLAVLGARLVSAAWPARRGAVGWLAAALAAGVLVPFGAIEEATTPNARNEVMAWTRQAARALADAPPARSIRLEARCPSPEATAASAARLEAFQRASERGDGIRWAAGLDPGVRVDPPGDAELTLRYCAGREPPFRVAR
ncbi:MAG TPA: hypothetical protein RMH99_01615, partial [Sandaracinaceae bacterium LLY-WYZ-13_1]|nr:hypothetical protein [Sandaracinaceae bacterium LLY-WYZ-13_1]